MHIGRHLEVVVCSNEDVEAPCYLLHCLLVLVGALEQLVQRHCILLELGGVGNVWHMQPVEWHEGNTPTPRLVEQPHQVKAHTVILNNHLCERTHNIMWFIRHEAQ